jgi:NADH-quinone oxidoreductase subunit I
MNGLGILKGLRVTLKHFFETYWIDIIHSKRKLNNTQIAASLAKADTKGLFTVQYPEQHVILPEEFRVIPFLVYETAENGERKYRCTACGICAKVCPTQCIWITRMKNETTGRPVPASEEFYIDTDKCMNCGSCAEFCPFDAIKMNHDFEIATHFRGDTHIYNKEKLGKPVEYYAKIRPVNYERETDARREKAVANQ